jgi:hypothetical protein
MEVSGQLHAPPISTPREKAPRIHWIGGWVCPRAGLDTEVNRKILSPFWESNPRSSKPVAQGYTTEISRLIFSIAIWHKKKKRPSVGSELSDASPKLCLAYPDRWPDSTASCIPSCLPTLLTTYLSFESILHTVWYNVAKIIAHTHPVSVNDLTADITRSQHVKHVRYYSSWSTVRGWDG